MNVFVKDDNLFEIQDHSRDQQGDDEEKMDEPVEEEDEEDEEEEEEEMEEAEEAETAEDVGKDETIE